MSLRRRLARRLRSLADRIDHHGAPKRTHWTFTYENREGIRFREDGRGCPLWYYGDEDHRRAHTEADTEHVQVDWANARARRIGGPSPAAKTLQVIVHSIAEDGLPDMGRLTGEVAFIFHGCIVSGWPLHVDPTNHDTPYSGYWEANDDVGRNVKFANVTHWVEFPEPLWRIGKAATR